MRVRVVGLTVILGAVVVLGVGSFVLNDVANGLARERTQDAFGESDGAVQEVQTALYNADVTDIPSLEGRLDDLITRLEGSPGPSVREAVLLRAEDNTSALAVRERFSFSLVDNPVSPQLRAAVTADPTVQQAQLVSLRADASGSRRVPAVVVGRVVELPLAGTHELYLVYRMDDQVATLQLVERAFIVGGLALVALVGTIAWLVARLVVTPVREAARTAERLAAGDLDRRMAVHGEDEVARLAASFNIMASSLQAQITRLESLSRLQQRFVSDVSHELRTPLTTIRMAADVLRDRLEPDESVDADTARSVVLLGTQIDRFESLLADLLEVSRFDAGAAELDVERVDLLDIVRQCVDLAQPVADRHGVEVTITNDEAADEPTHDPPEAGRREASVMPLTTTAHADPRRVSRIVRNLLNNAIEHAEGGGVQLSVAANPDAVAIGVRDFGVGMSGDQLERVFDRFWRGDPSRRRTLGGSGLGLAISLEDARLHGGRLEVWSEAGQGAHFVVTLPRRLRTGLGTGPIAVGPPPSSVIDRRPETATEPPRVGSPSPDESLALRS